MTGARQRIASLESADWTDAMRDLFTINGGPEAWHRGPKYNISKWFANHPALLGPWLRYNQALSRGVLPARLREIVILRVAHIFGSDYEWSMHVEIAKRMGLEDRHFADLAANADADFWTGHELCCLRAADQLCRDNDIADALWQELETVLDTQQIMELLFLIGSYTLLAWVLKAVRIPVEDYLE